MIARRISGRRKSDFVPESFIRALQKGIHGFRMWPERYQWHITKLVWEEGLRRRTHRLKDGYMTVGYKELENSFGRGGFAKMNAALGIFEVTPNWHWQAGRANSQNATKAYKLSPKASELKERYLKPRRDAVTRLIYLDSKDAFVPLKSAPKPIAAKVDDDPLGVTATAWRNAKIFNKVPVDLDLLRELHAYLVRMLRPENLPQGDIFLVAEAEDIERRAEWAGQIIKLAHTDVAGRGYVLHRYAECKTGRLYAKGVSLQTAPRLIRAAALHGLYDYDIENCHYAIFAQLAAQCGYHTQAVQHYLIHKDDIREGIARRVGISVKQAKMTLLALMFGARTTERPDNAIPREIGPDKARTLYRDEEFSAIARDVGAGRDVILKAWPTGRTTLLNDMGKSISLKTKPEIRIAHILQGIEAKSIRTAIDLFPDEIVLLMHDGFVTTRPIDKGLVEQRMFTETGYRLSLSGGVIELPPDLGFSKM